MTAEEYYLQYNNFKEFSTVNLFRDDIILLMEKYALYILEEASKSVTDTDDLDDLESLID